MSPDKNHIRRRFTRAAATYDRQASVQLRVAERLLRLLTGQAVPPPRRVLEIGSCTGILTAALTRQFPGIGELFVNDLVPQFESLIVAKIPPGMHCSFLAGDIEAIDLPADLDLVISSSTFHWLTDLPALLDRLQARMAGNGILCFSIYGPENLRELREVTGIGLDYHPLSALRQMVAQRFTLLACEEELITYRVPDPLALLQHLRQTGVNALESGAWSRTRLAEFSRAYTARYGGEGGVPLSYHPVYFLARRTTEPAGSPETPPTRSS